MAHVATAAAVAGASAHRPPALSISFSSSGHSRHSSASSSASARSDDEPSALSALDSSAALILVHDQDERDADFDFSDEENNDAYEDVVSPLFQVRKSVVYSPLPPSLVFLYLLVPYLKLGALELPNSGLPLRHGLPALIFSAIASLFARHIWYMLARYLRKADMVDILIETFAKGRGKEKQRMVIRLVVRSGTGAISTLLAITYLRHAMYTLQSFMPTSQHPALTYVLSTLTVGIVIVCLSYARSLSSRRIVYATWLSVALYIAWLACTTYAHVHGLLEAQIGWLGGGYTWQGLATTVFAFCSSSTLPLYVSLKSSTPGPISTGKVPRSRSFRILSSLSTVSAVLFLLPSVIYAAFPNHPATVSTSLISISPSSPYVHSAQSYFSVQQIDPQNTTDSISTPILSTFTSTESLNATLIPVLPSLSSSSIYPDIILPSIPLNTIRNVLASIILLLGVPISIMTTPPIPMHSLRSAKTNVSRLLISFFVIFLSLFPPHSFPSTDDELPSYIYSSSFFFTALTTIFVLASLIGTYFLPALLHILLHTFKRPLAIVVPPRTPLLQTQSQGQSPLASTSGEADRLSPRTGADELLLRKERALQKRQFRKRIGWDIGVWLLLGVSAVGIVAIGAGLLGVW